MKPSTALLRAFVPPIEVLTFLCGAAAATAWSCGGHCTPLPPWPSGEYAPGTATYDWQRGPFLFEPDSREASGGTITITYTDENGDDWLVVYRG